MPIDHTHEATLRSWVDAANDPASDFPIQSLPLARVEEADEGEGAPGWAVVIGDRCVLLGELIDDGFFDDGPDRLGLDLLATECEQGRGPTLSRENARFVRDRLSRALRAGAAEGLRRAVEGAMVPSKDVRFLTPGAMQGYTDFYASVHHASTVGAMFRPDNPLLPNYKHVPIGYHGRASSIVPTGTPVRRPMGQQSPPEDNPGAGPAFGPCKMLDYELEVGCVIGLHNDLGTSVPVSRAMEHVVGLCLVNDWSARDIQKWEYQPLGPFLAKNFATSVSAVIVTLDALAPFRCPAYARPAGDPAPLPYLADASDQQAGGFALTLEVAIQSAQMAERGLAPHVVCRSDAFKDMYWTFAQMVAHHTSNGCNLRPGDLLASGTVSGREPGTRGCLLEATWDGPGKPRKPIELPSGEKRAFLADGDTVIMRGWAEREGYRRIGLGECRGTVLPASG